MKCAKQFGNTESKNAIGNIGKQEGKAVVYYQE